MAERGVVEQLIDHLVSPPLRGAKVAGLPREWFEQLASRASSDSSVEFQQNSAQEILSANESASELPAARLVPPVGQSQLPEQPKSIRDDSFGQLSLEQLKAQALGCVACRLCETRNKVVFGVGKTDSPLIAFVGEGPGADEDRLGEPFVGRAGELLTKAITAGLGLSRNDVYIANVVKCRPPENRAPLPDEVEACTRYLYRQLELIQPKVIVTLGQPAQMALSGVNQGITKLRGNWQTWRGIKLMPTFHPAYLLRNPPAKKEFWEDLKAVMAELGLQRERPQSGVRTEAED